VKAPLIGHSLLYKQLHFDKIAGPYFAHVLRIAPTIEPWIVTTGMKSSSVMNSCQLGFIVAQFYEWLGIIFDLEVDQILV